MINNLLSLLHPLLVQQAPPPVRWGRNPTASFHSWEGATSPGARRRVRVGPLPTICPFAPSPVTRPAHHSPTGHRAIIPNTTMAHQRVVSCQTLSSKASHQPGDGLNPLAGSPHGPRGWGDPTPQGSGEHGMLCTREPIFTYLWNS